jgi:hypothetical protein
MVWAWPWCGRIWRQGEAIERPGAEKVPGLLQGSMESDIHQQEPPKVSWDRCGDGGRGSENWLYISDSSHCQGFGEAPQGSWTSQTREKQLGF